ncbi:MAG: twin-arginine translocation pathway signal protein [Verrucomicrobiota bacterium]
MKYTLLALVVAALTIQSVSADFASSWATLNNRTWIGPQYWANPLQDWQIKDGRVECTTIGANRNLFLLTHELSPDEGNLTMSVRLGKLNPDATEGIGGFRIGIQGTLPDYRNAAIHGRGTDVGITADGTLTIGNTRGEKGAIDTSQPIELTLSATPKGNQYALTLTATPSGTNRNATLNATLPAAKLIGSVALLSSVSSAGERANRNKSPKNTANKASSFWFEDWKIDGSKLTSQPEQSFGPVFWTQYTLSRGIMKMTAFLPPVGEKDSQTVTLETKDGDSWKSIASETIDPLSRTVLFRLEDWDASKDVPYRVAYNLDGADHYWPGTIRKDPVDQNKVSVAGFTGNQDYLFPNTRMVTNVGIQNPDVLFFSGDQIYEGVAGFGFVREPVGLAALDYLRKYWLLGWAFGDLMRDRPTVCLPDDHDVYQGNIWGHNGRKAVVPGFADGGFHMNAEWVNMVNRTQTGNLPDPVDPKSLLRGITVYFTDMLYGGVSFAIIEDRKFKTGPEAVLPPKNGRRDHVRPEDIPEGETFDPLTLDLPEARLLGERQLKFLREWAQDWRGAQFKCVLSQTIFANLANFHGNNQEYLIADLDSNGWPQSGRNRALDEIRKGFGFMYAGDQHLASIVHHGINQDRDAGVSFCVPSIAAGYPRAWRPEKPWLNHQAGDPDYTGDFKEGLGNRVGVHAIGNPEDEPRKDTPETLGHDKASGHGLVIFDKADHSITMECWRLLFDANSPTAEDQFPGWPRTIAPEDNYGREAIAHLPTIKVNGLTNPVIQIVDQSWGDVVYTLRINGETFRPKIFDANGAYTIIVSEPDEEVSKTISDVRPAEDQSETIEVDF